jgi:hypothetical protein
MTRSKAGTADGSFAGVGEVCLEHVAGLVSDEADVGSG